MDRCVSEHRRSLAPILAAGCDSLARGARPVVRISTRALSGRRLCFRDRPRRRDAACLPRDRIPRDHRRLLRGACSIDAELPPASRAPRWRPGRSRASERQALAARLPPARTRPQARAQDRARGLAAADCRQAPRRVRARPDPLRRLPDDEPLQDEAAERAGCGVCVRALLLLEPVGGHPRPVLRRVRRARRALDALQPPQRVCRAPP